MGIEPSVCVDVCSDKKRKVWIDRQSKEDNCVCCDLKCVDNKQKQKQKKKISFISCRGKREGVAEGWLQEEERERRGAVAMMGWGVRDTV